MKPRIVITVGDPAGIGPEVVAAAVRHPKVLAACTPVVVGDPVAFKRHRIPLPRVEMLPVPGLRKDFPLGSASPEGGKSALEALRLGVGLIQNRQAHALVTSPISKEALHLAHAGIPGHTEWLARQCGVSKVAMMMISEPPRRPPLRAILMTRHVPLAKAAGHLTAKVIRESAELGNDFVKSILKKARPRLALCALNPHAGDNGLIGHEEETLLKPALRVLARSRLRVAGPLPSDSAFRDMAHGLYDLLLATYHDQAMIPLKLYSFDHLVNVTLGLPFMRTSPGHGTAYDIAGRGRANPNPTLEAILKAAEFCGSR